MKRLLVSALVFLGFSSTVIAAPVQWSAADGGNDHWYEIVYLGGGEITWNTAYASAITRTHDGETGYLATVTSTQEQEFLNGVNAAYAASSPYVSTQYVTAWLGASDVAAEGTWNWVTGETFDYTNWGTRQPNDYGFYGQDYLAGWWNNSMNWRHVSDQWNDCSGTCGIRKFVVEYDPDSSGNNQPPPVPLPAGLPLLAAAIGAFGMIRRRRKTT